MPYALSPLPNPRSFVFARPLLNTSNRRFLLISENEQLVIPKHHGRTLADIPDEHLSEILPVVKKLAAASGAQNWNLLQNNGRVAHQEVDHVSTILHRCEIPGECGLSVD